MPRLTQVTNYTIKEGQYQNVVDGLGSLAELARDENYFHPTNPPTGTPLVHERFRGITSGLRIETITGIASKDYVPVARVDPMTLHLENGDVLGYLGIHTLILATVGHHLSDVPPISASAPQGDNIAQRV